MNKENLKLALWVSFALVAMALFSSIYVWFGSQCVYESEIVAGTVVEHNCDTTYLWTGNSVYTDRDYITVILLENGEEISFEDSFTYSKVEEGEEVLVIITNQFYKGELANISYTITEE